MRSRALFPALVMACLGFTALPEALAENQSNPAARAANIARIRAESLNGGLGVYRPASCMHERGGGACLVESGSEGFMFRFFGGVPGWQQLGKPPTVETEILVAPDAQSILRVIYNGPPRN